MHDDAPLLAEAQRQFLICSACRYCEGYCATFPALERRTTFGEADVAYLANLCHDCRACAQACMYGPPHEFAVDIPGLLSRARLETYRERAVPRAARGAFGGAGGGAMLAVGLAAAALLLAAIAATGRWGRLAAVDDAAGAFYRTVPFPWMLVPALLLAAWGAFALWAAARRLVCDVLPGARATARERLGALHDGLALVYMKGGGGGCYYPETTDPSQARRILHVTLVAGVALAFAATLAAAFEQDVLGRLPPYPVASVPVVLGILGGICALAGALGLLALKAAPGARRLEAPAMVALDAAFLIALTVVAATGLALLLGRASAAMGPLLVVHLAAVAALFATAPYGKLMHVPLRLAALVVFRIEEARERGAS